MKKNLRETIRKASDFEQMYDWKKHEPVPHDHRPIQKRPKYPDEFADEYLDEFPEEDI